MFKGGRCLCPQLDLVPAGILLRSFRELCALPHEPKPQIKIHKRIERGPTDILKALSETVQRDPTAYDYKFPDDPLFYPGSHLMKRRLALSLESGKSAAKWIVKNHPDFFQKPISDPLIKGYIPELKSYENAEVEEKEMLERAILEEEVVKAIEVYKSLESKGTELSKDIKQNLLELTCFYNCENKKDFEELETKWFEVDDRSMFKLWKSTNFAENLFESIGADCPLACAAIISGRLKYYEVKSSINLFNECKTKGMKFPLEVYNEILGRVCELTSGLENRLNYIKDTLKEMNQEGIQPNLYTLNSILKTLAECKENKEMKLFIFQTVGEFKKLKIEPSLGSYYHIFTIFEKDKVFLLNYIKDTLSSLLENKLEIQHPDDFMFFFSTMRIIGRLKSLEAAHILNKLLWKHDNMKFINSELFKNYYFKSYFELVFKMEPLENAMEIYRTLCPTVYIPETYILKIILKTVQKFCEFSLVPELWADFKKNKVSKTLLPSFLKMAVFYEGKEKDEISSVFYEAAMMAYFEPINSNNFNPLEITSETMSHVFIACLKYGDLERALQVFSKAQNHEVFLTIEVLQFFCKYCLTRKMYSLFMESVKLGRPNPGMVNIVEQALPELSDLPEEDIEWLKDYVRKQKNLAKNEVKNELPENVE